jgi:hypothetical protein
MDCEGIRVKPILALLPEGSNEIGVLRRLSIGLRTCRLECVPTWPLLPSSRANQCVNYGGRSCLPLRDSSGLHTGFPYR